MAIVAAFQGGYIVTQDEDESGDIYHVVNARALLIPDKPSHIATYRKRWRAENHAITQRCGCRQNWHTLLKSCEPPDDENDLRMVK